MTRRLALIALLIGVSCANAASLRAGAAVVDVTPQPGMLPIPLVGNWEEPPAKVAHDPLTARAIVLEDGRTRLAIVVVDSCMISREILDKAKDMAGPESGIPVSRMLIAATHTHTAPGSDNAVYKEFLTRQIAAAVKAAAAKLQPAEAGWAVTPLPEFLNNRRWYMRPGSIPPNPYGETTDQVMMNPSSGSPDLIRPAGPVDPGVSILSIRTASGRPLALLANYSLHYIGDPPDGQISADYFGEFQRQIAQRLGTRGFVGILSNGTSGDVNNINFRKPEPERPPFTRIRTVAGRVADAVFASYQGIRHRADLDLAMAEREIALQARKPTPTQRAFVRKVLAAKDDRGLPQHARIYAERAMEAERGPAEVRIKLQALRIGDLGIAAIPFEVFTEMGLEIKKRSPLHPSFTMELANGAEGYLPTPAQHALGGYETWLGTNRVEIQASEKITATVLELLRSISGGR